MYFVLKYFFSIYCSYESEYRLQTWIFKRMVSTFIINTYCNNIRSNPHCVLIQPRNYVCKILSHHLLLIQKSAPTANILEYPPLNYVPTARTNGIHLKRSVATQKRSTLRYAVAHPRTGNKSHLDPSQPEAFVPRKRITLSRANLEGEWSFILCHPTGLEEYRKINKELLTVICYTAILIRICEKDRMGDH